MTGIAAVDRKTAHLTIGVRRVPVAARDEKARTRRPPPLQLTPHSTPHPIQHS
jgi:hypothetical protein